MRDLNALRAAGFTIQPAPDAEGCTEVLHDQPFYYYNPRFVSPDEVLGKIENSSIDIGRDVYRVVIAGPIPVGHEPLAFSILTEAQRDAFSSAVRAHNDAIDLVKQKHQDLFLLMDEHN